MADTMTSQDLFPEELTAIMEIKSPRASPVVDDLFDSNVLKITTQQEQAAPIWPDDDSDKQDGNNDTTLLPLAYSRSHLSDDYCHANTNTSYDDDYRNPFSTDIHNSWRSNSSSNTSKRRICRPFSEDDIDYAGRTRYTFYDISAITAAAQDNNSSPSSSSVASDHLEDDISTTQAFQQRAPLNFVQRYFQQKKKRHTTTMTITHDQIFTLRDGDDDDDDDDEDDVDTLGNNTVQYNTRDNTVDKQRIDSYNNDTAPYNAYEPEESDTVPYAVHEPTSEEQGADLVIDNTVPYDAQDPVEDGLERDAKTKIIGKDISPENVDKGDNDDNDAEFEQLGVSDVEANQLLSNMAQQESYELDESELKKQNQISNGDLISINTSDQASGTRVATDNQAHLDDEFGSLDYDDIHSLLSGLGQQNTLSVSSINTTSSTTISSSSRHKNDSQFIQGDVICSRFTTKLPSSAYVKERKEHYPTANKANKNALADANNRLDRQTDLENFYSQLTSTSSLSTAKSFSDDESDDQDRNNHPRISSSPVGTGSSSNLSSAASTCSSSLDQLRLERNAKRLTETPMPNKQWIQSSPPKKSSQSSIESQENKRQKVIMEDTLAKDPVSLDGSSSSITVSPIQPRPRVYGLSKARVTSSSVCAGLPPSVATILTRTKRTNNLKPTNIITKSSRAPMTRKTLGMTRRPMDIYQR